MRGAFDVSIPKTKSATTTNRDYGLREFIIRKGGKYRVVVLDPSAAGIESFFLVARHFVQLPDGKYVKIPCMQKEGYNVRCLACYGLEKGILRAPSWAKEAMYNIALPIYDMTKYRKAFDQAANREIYQPLDPSLPHYPEPNDIVGGFKVWWATDSQFKTIRTENEAVSNVCAACNGNMRIDGLECSSCGSPIYDADALSKLTQEEYDDLIYDTHVCPVCGVDTVYVRQRKCLSCGGEKSKTLHDFVLMVHRAVTRTSSGKETSSYVIKVEPHTAPEVEDTPNWFWSQYKKLKEPLPLPRQAELLKMEIPKEWSDSQEIAQHAYPYGGR